MLKITVGSQEYIEARMREYEKERAKHPTSIYGWGINASNLIGIADGLVRALKDARFDGGNVHHHCYECGLEAYHKLNCGMYVCPSCFYMWDYKSCASCDGTHEACQTTIERLVT